MNARDKGTGRPVQPVRRIHPRARSLAEIEAEEDVIHAEIAAYGLASPARPARRVAEVGRRAADRAARIANQLLEEVLSASVEQLQGQPHGDDDGAELRALLARVEALEVDVERGDDDGAELRARVVRLEALEAGVERAGAELRALLAHVISPGAADFVARLEVARSERSE